MDKSNKSGPKPSRVKIDRNWEDAVKSAMKKEKPKEGWPESPKKQKKSVPKS